MYEDHDWSTPIYALTYKELEARVKELEARLAAVLALCDRIEAESATDVHSWDVRAAAAGDTE